MARGWVSFAGIYGVFENSQYFLDGFAFDFWKINLYIGIFSNFLKFVSLFVVVGFFTSSRWARHLCCDLIVFFGLLKQTMPESRWKFLNFLHVRIFQKFSTLESSLLGLLEEGIIYSDSFSDSIKSCIRDHPSRFWFWDSSEISYFLTVPVRAFVVFLKNMFQDFLDTIKIVYGKCIYNFHFLSTQDLL